MSELLVAGRDLDRQVGEAMGWRVTCVATPGWWIDAGYVLVDAAGLQLGRPYLSREDAEAEYPHLSTDLHAALNYLLPWLGARGERGFFYMIRHPAGRGSAALLWEVSLWAKSAIGCYQPTLQLALCEAVLTVVQESS